MTQDHEPTDSEMIEKLQRQEGEYARRREFLVRKRSQKFKKIAKEETLQLHNGKYLMSEYPIDPAGVKVYGAKFPINTVVIHGREILWTGRGMSRPPASVTVEYEAYDK